ncbi:MAG: mevalonate kinase [Bdellovibrionales bacterium]|nr:mevalonate kinase [Bdellovibrionales bacterium]
MTSSCGKFILGGEHSVVHRGRALAFPLRQLTLSYEESADHAGLWLNGEQRSEEEWKKIQELCRRMGAAHAVKGVRVESQLPVGGGLGSSAALCTAMARFYRPELQGEELALLAMHGEELFHGRPSGVDPFTIALDQPIAFSSADRRWRALQCDQFQRSELCFVLVDSGERHRTAEVIAATKGLQERTPLIWDDLMDSLSTNAERMIAAFEREPATQLGRLMNDTHLRLSYLGVSDAALDKVVEDLRSRGALGAKLTGAGRGGFALGLFRLSDLPSPLPTGWIVQSLT